MAPNLNEFSCNVIDIKNYDVFYHDNINIVCSSSLFKFSSFFVLLDNTNIKTE